jgi:hypothetical protein
MRDASAYENELERLAAALRADAHLAVDATVNQDLGKANAAGTLELTVPGAQTVQYAIFPQRIERTELVGDTSGHRETFRLPPAVAARWQVDSERGTPLVSLVVARRLAETMDETGVSSMYRIDAALRLVSAGLASPNN